MCNYQFGLYTNNYFGYYPSYNYCGGYPSYGYFGYVNPMMQRDYFGYCLGYSLTRQLMGGGCYSAYNPFYMNPCAYTQTSNPYAFSTLNFSSYIA